MSRRRKELRDPRLYWRDGRFIWARVRDKRGRVVRKSTKCSDETAAIEWANEFERKAASPSYRRAADASLEQAIGEYLTELTRRRVSAATYEIAETKLGHFVRLWGGDLPLLRIEADLVLAFIDTREKEGRQPITVKRELLELKRCLEWAKFRGCFPTDLATVFPPKYSSRHKPRTRWLPMPEAMALLQALEPRRAAHVAFILATGARLGESLRARAKDVHLDVDNPHVEIRGTKTVKAADTVAVTGLTYPFLLYAMENAPGRERLFHPWGKMVRDLAAACERAGIAKASANDLRRTFGKWHRLAGVPVEQVAVMLRHTTDKLAQTTYAQVTGADIGPRLRELVPILYPETASTDPNHPNEDHDPMGKPASPARFELATTALGNLGTPDASNRRSIGTKLGKLRAMLARNVPFLSAREDTEFPEEELSDIAAVFPLARAVSAPSDSDPDLLGLGRVVSGRAP